MKDTEYRRLPRDFELIENNDKLYVKLRGRFIVSEGTGTRKHFKGIDEAAYQRALKWCGRYADGWTDGYRLANENEVIL